MKKIIYIILAFVILFNVSASAETWAVTVPLDENSLYVINLIKVDNSFFVAGVQLDKTSNGYKFVEKDGMYIIDEDGETHKAQIVGDKLFYQLVPDGATVMLSKVEDFDKSFSTYDGTFKTDALIVSDTSAISPITVPAGVYTAGEDFPAGVYRIEIINESNTSHIRLYDNMEKIAKAFSYKYDYDIGSYYGSTVVGKIEILEGNALEVRGSAVQLVPYEGLK